MNAKMLRLSDGVHIITIKSTAKKTEILTLLKMLAADWLGEPVQFDNLSNIEIITEEPKSAHQIWIEQILKNLGNPQKESDFKIGFAHAVASGKIDPKVLKILADVDPSDTFLGRVNMPWLPSFVKQFVFANENDRNIFITF